MWQVKLDNQLVKNVETKEEAEQLIMDLILQEYMEVDGDIICEEGDDTRFDHLLNDPEIIIHWRILLPLLQAELKTGQCKGIGGYTLYTLNQL